MINKAKRKISIFDKQNFISQQPDWSIVENDPNYIKQKLNTHTDSHLNNNQEFHLPYKQKIIKYNKYSSNKSNTVLAWNNSDIGQNSILIQKPKKNLNIETCNNNSNNIINDTNEKLSQQAGSLCKNFKTVKKKYNNSDIKISINRIVLQSKKKYLPEQQINSEMQVYLLKKQFEYLDDDQQNNQIKVSKFPRKQDILMIRDQRQYLPRKDNFLSAGKDTSKLFKIDKMKLKGKNLKSFLLNHHEETHSILIKPDQYQKINIINKHIQSSKVHRPQSSKFISQFNFSKPICNHQKTQYDYSDQSLNKTQNTNATINNQNQIKLKAIHAKQKKGFQAYKNRSCNKNYSRCSRTRNKFDPPQTSSSLCTKYHQIIKGKKLNSGNNNFEEGLLRIRYPQLY